MWGIIAIIGVAAIVAAVLLSHPRKTTVDEIEPYRAEVGPGLAAFIRALNQISSTDDPEYARALEALRSARQEVLADSARLLGSESDAPFAVRHSTLLAVSSLRDPLALDLLSAVALNPQPLPPKDSQDRSAIDSHGGGALAAGTILALDALEGIEALADDGLEAALEVLVRAAAVDSNAVRGVALTALAARAEWRDHFERAKAALPRELLHLAQLRRIPVEEVPQIGDPRLHLAGPEKGGASAPARVERGTEGETGVAPAHGAPRVERK